MTWLTGLAAKSKIIIIKASLSFQRYQQSMLDGRLTNDLVNRFGSQKGKYIIKASLSFHRNQQSMLKSNYLNIKYIKLP